MPPMHAAVRLATGANTVVPLKLISRRDLGRWPLTLAPQLSLLLNRSIANTAKRCALSPKRLAPLANFNIRFKPRCNTFYFTKTRSLHSRSVLATPKDQDISPDVILICGWMGAQPIHLQKYTHAYSKLYPNASQIVVQCHPDLFWTTAGTRIRAADALEALHCLPSSSSQNRPRILTHAFSNGGSLQMILLGRMLKRIYGSASGALTSAIIFDSTPSVNNIRAFKLGYSIVFRNPIFRSIAYVISCMMQAIRFVGLSAVFGEGMVVMANLHVELWNSRILPWMGLHTPRLYLFSRVDKFIPWQDVTRHAETAKDRGMHVHCELFEESEHVAHPRVEPERYWSSVQEVWKTAISKEKGEDQKI